MSGNLLVINVDIREIRVALIEDGVIAELHIERLSSRNTFGNVYLGKVSRVLPGMQAAFIDIGEERAAFLHVEDLIRPDDFEAYLAGARLSQRDDSDEEGADKADAEADVDAEAAEAEAAEDVDAEAAEDDEADAAADVDAVAAEDAEAEPAEADEAEADSDEADADDTQTAEADEEVAADDDDDVEVDFADDVTLDAEPDSVEEPAVEADSVEEPAVEAEADAESDASAEPEAQAQGDTAAAGADEVAAEAGGDEDAPTGRRRRRSRRARVSRSSRSTEATLSTTASARSTGGRKSKRTRRGGKDSDDDKDGRRRGGGGRGDRNRRGRSRKKATSKSRISKTTPIREVVREGQDVVVQVTKEPIGTKGARVSSHISLPGRYVVYLPTVEHVGISKRIGSDKERGRLRSAIDSVKPPTGGLVVRTVAEGLTKKHLKNDVGYLVRLWDEIARKREEATKAPSLIYEELDLILKTARDLFTEDVGRVVIDNREQHGRLCRFVEMFMPDRVDDVELYEGREPVFDAYGIEDEIGRALARKVPLTSGGHLVIDQAEALTAIDVNTGRFVGKGQKDLEATIVQANLEAVEEIAYQLRFRNIGGLIILDLIDMDRASNRTKVRRRLESLLAKDKAKTTLNRISDLGLIEMTRKRTRESLGRLMHEPCFYCDGTGQLMSRETIAYEILRQIRREQSHLQGYSITVNAHSAIIDLLKNDEQEAVQEAERMFQRRIKLVAQEQYHIEQFDLVGG